LNNYKNYNDYELIYLINEGSELALNIFFEKYEPYINKVASFYLSKYDSHFDDLVQEGRILLFDNIKSYRTNSKTSFFTYFTINYKRRIYRLLSSDYYNLPTLKEDIIVEYNPNKYSHLSGKKFFKEKEKIRLFDECIIGKQTLRNYAIKYNIKYGKVYYLYKKIIEELKIILK
jgi:DNA-directed RNA polymerase sigma subunit (sigma70/sigma32)